MMSQGLGSRQVRLHHRHKNAIHMNVRGTLCTESGAIPVFEVEAAPYNTGSIRMMGRRSLCSHGTMVSWDPSTMGVPRIDRLPIVDRVQSYVFEIGSAAVVFGMSFQRRARTLILSTTWCAE